MTDSITVTQTTQNVIVTNTPTSLSISQVGAQGPTGAPGVVPVFTRQNEINVTVGKSRFYFDSPRTISQIRASLGTPPTGSNAVFDTLVNGISIGTTTIAAGTYTTTTTVSKAVVAGDYATISILSVGSTYSGADLVVTLTVN